MTAFPAHSGIDRPLSDSLRIIYEVASRQGRVRVTLNSVDQICFPVV